MKLSEDTNKIIKKVKTDKRDINLLKKGSFIIYSNENKITKNDTKDTVKIIKELKKSIVKLQ
jgi:hypothetical protein